MRDPTGRVVLRLAGSSRDCSGQPAAQSRVCCSRLLRTMSV